MDPSNKIQTCGLHKNDKTLCSNYRPISLLPIINKVLERCILNQIYPIIYPMISNKQHGFIKGRSSITHLLEVYSEINTHLDNNVQVDIIYLDFAKVFDSIPHNVLIAKLTSPVYYLALAILAGSSNSQSGIATKCTIPNHLLETLKYLFFTCNM